MKINNIIPLAIVLLLMGILLPIGLNQITSNPITASVVDNRTNSDETLLYLNGSETPNGLFNGSILEPDFDNFTLVSVNTTTAYGGNSTFSFKIDISNTSVITLNSVEVSVNLGVYASFVSIFASNFTFNTLYNFNLLSTYNVLNIRINSTQTENTTISVSAYTTEITTNANTIRLNAIYQVVPIVAVVSIILLFAKFKKD